MIIKSYDPAALLKRTMREVMRDDVLGRSAQAAYSFFFSLFPLLLFLAPLFGLIGKDREILSRSGRSASSRWHSQRSRWWWSLSHRW